MINPRPMHHSSDLCEKPRRKEDSSVGRIPITNSSSLSSIVEHHNCVEDHSWLDLAEMSLSGLE